MAPGGQEADLQPSKHPSYTNKNITMNVITFLTPNPPKSYKFDLKPANKRVAGL